MNEYYNDFNYQISLHISLVIISFIVTIRYLNSVSDNNIVFNNKNQNNDNKKIQRNKVKKK